MIFLIENEANEDIIIMNARLGFNQMSMYTTIARALTLTCTPTPAVNVWWVLLLIFSCIPAAASNVYKEYGLKGYKLDVWLANGWIALFQFLWGLASVWTIRLGAFVGKSGIDGIGCVL